MNNIEKQNLAAVHDGHAHVSCYVQSVCECVCFSVCQNVRVS